MIVRRRQHHKLLVVAMVALAACSSNDDAPAASAPDAVTLPTDVPVADDLFVGTDDGLLPTAPTDPDLAVPNADEGPGADIDAPTDPGASAPELGEPLVTTTPPSIPIEPPAAGVTPRIVSLSGTHTEMLFAMGAGDLVVAVAAENNFVGDAAPLEDLSLELRTSLLGDLTAAYEPTLVIVDTTDVPALGTLAAADLALYAAAPAASLDEIYGQITDLGELAGRPVDAAALVERMQNDVDGIIAELGPLVDAGLTFFHEVDPTLVTFDDSNFLVGLFSELGLTNVFVTVDSGGFPQMTLTEITAADPDVITLGDVDCCDVTIDSLRARPGWDELSAIRSNAVVPLTTAQYSSWGPGVVDVLRLVATAMASADQL